MNCFDRESETAELWRLFDTERNVLMLAPRRIGKTVLLHRLRDTAALHSRRAIVLDVEGAREPKDFFRTFCSVIQEQLDFGAKVVTAFKQRLTRVLGGSEEDDWRKMLIANSWVEFAEHLVAHLDEHGDDQPWVILVDELPIFVKALLERGQPGAASDFLYELRRLRQKYRRVRWLYTGSIGLDAIARRHGFEGALNDVELYTLRPFAAETAAAFLTHLAVRRGAAIDLPAIDAILSRLEWLAPYYLFRIAEDACTQAGTGNPVGLAAAHAAMDRLLHVEKRLYWSSWREHVDLNFPEPQRTRLHLVLAEVAGGAAPISRSAIAGALNRTGEPVPIAAVVDLVDTLVTDGFLVEHGGHYRFQMPLLREWWVRYVLGG